ncbi:hypothetical protein NSK_006370 [Nannochloropsis salina CCMP1776]|uniref:NAD-dependent epimerase/dehydratase domain-containing protein n=1 Tax=Nannochloropsis salina CCMP1776 TaxID=1027361 RepID=A0A4D9CSU8_9STRA|nr:hypothetical protein NSK_006370 [Nannochloropsis salina CCMP1776]|eukprot:TFJ82250.1 hypothetical protein NSK_006370 [Nannochloropsis salina CCMP1776]
MKVVQFLRLYCRKNPMQNSPPPSSSFSSSSSKSLFTLLLLSSLLSCSTAFASPSPPTSTARPSSSSPSSFPPTTVCVTGCNGYVASELVKQLLERGYNVHGTVRNLHKLTEEEREEKYGPLAKLGRGRGGGGGGGQRERVGRQRKEDSRGPCDEGGGDGEKGRGCLTLFEADLRQPHSFDAAVRGCTYVFHVASPVVYASGADPEKDLLQPALEGVRNVLRAIQDSRREEGGREGVRAEREAWKEGGGEGGREGLDMVVICPSYVWGPPAVKGAQSLNAARLAAILQGKEAPWPFDFPVCDVRDVAAAHIAAAEQASASGRYIVSSSHTVTPAWVSAVIDRYFPDRFPQLPRGEGSPRATSKKVFDVRKAERLLGRPLRGPEETLRDMVQALLEAWGEGGV